MTKAGLLLTKYPHTLLHAVEGPNVLETVNVNMYADDTAIYIDATDQKDVVKCLSDELVRVSKWCQNNRLVIQVKQSFAMFLLSGRKQSTDPVVHLDGTTLETKPYADYLGVALTINFHGRGSQKGYR